MEWSPISERIILACFKTKICNLTIIHRNDRQGYDRKILPATA